jgi:hypothetical protein
LCSPALPVACPQLLCLKSGSPDWYMRQSLFPWILDTSLARSASKITDILCVIRRLSAAVTLSLGSSQSTRTRVRCACTGNLFKQLYSSETPPQSIMSCHGLTVGNWSCQTHSTLSMTVRWIPHSLLASLVPCPDGLATHKVMHYK